MPSPFHSGELTVQSRLGVREQADDLTGMIRATIPAAVAEFLAQHAFAILSATDEDGNVWASPIAGPAGILSAPDPGTVGIHLDRLDPPLAPELVHGEFAGLLVIDFDRRLRIRINGTLTRTPEALLLRVVEFYGNCTKYIQRRSPRPECPPSVKGNAAKGSAALTEAQRAWIARSDTFFIATQHAHNGADASHRGGRPGFVTSPDAHTLVWPDYRGNNLFNTLGNLEVDPRAGLLFLDFDSGSSLQLTGKATLQISTPTTAAPIGRSIRFEISSVCELASAASLRYSLVEPFPYNPPIG